jgi:hypothetical protein
MKGDPIPGVHYLEIDLQGEYRVTQIVIDWEDGYSENYEISGSTMSENREMFSGLGKQDMRSNNDKLKKFMNQYKDKNGLTWGSGWHAIASSAQRKITGGYKWHRIHTVDVPQPEKVPPSRYVRLKIKSGATRWGVSIWRMQIYGY